MAQIHFSPLFLHVLHYGPTDGSKNGEEVLRFQHGLPGETWKEPDPSDPMSVIDQVCLMIKLSNGK